MPKKKKTSRPEGKLGFRANSKEGKYLSKLLKNKSVSPGITPGAIKELYPVFYKFKNDSFASGLRRMKTKFGYNIRGNTGTSIDIDRWLVLGSIDLLYSHPPPPVSSSR